MKQNKNININWNKRKLCQRKKKSMYFSSKKFKHAKITKKKQQKKQTKKHAEITTSSPGRLMHFPVYAV